MNSTTRCAINNIRSYPRDSCSAVGTGHIVWGYLPDPQQRNVTSLQRLRATSETSNPLLKLFIELVGHLKDLQAHYLCRKRDPPRPAGKYAIASEHFGSLEYKEVKDMEENKERSTRAPGGKYKVTVINTPPTIRNILNRIQCNSN